MFSTVTAQDAAVAETRGLETGAAGTADRAFAEGPSLLSAYAKRCFDVAASAVILIALIPVILIIALAIRIDDGGPVFYLQDRVGTKGRRKGRRIRWERRQFRIVKFRTMVRDSDRVPVHEEFIRSFVAGQEPAPGDTDSAQYKLSNDARVTRVGRFLRASSLDELPQFFNVLWGTMSLVGPRPVPPYEVELYEQRHRERLAAVPGITGMWQVLGRGRVGFEEMVRLDIEYVRRQSVWLDISLLVRTVPAVFHKRGAR